MYVQDFIISICSQLLEFSSYNFMAGTNLFLLLAFAAAVAVCLLWDTAVRRGHYHTELRLLSDSRSR